MTDHRTEQSAAQFWRDIDARIDRKVAAALKAPTGITPGVEYGSAIFDAAGNAVWGGAGGSSPLLVNVTYNVTVTSGVSDTLGGSATNYDPSTLWVSDQFTAPSDGWYLFIVDMHVYPTGGNIAAGDTFRLTLSADGGSYRLAHFEAYNTPASTPVFMPLTGAQAAPMTEGSHASIFYENLTSRTIHFVSTEQCNLNVLKVSSGL